MYLNIDSTLIAGFFDWRDDMAEDRSTEGKYGPVSITISKVHHLKLSLKSLESITPYLEISRIIVSSLNTGLAP